MLFVAMCLSSINLSLVKPKTLGLNQVLTALGWRKPRRPCELWLCHSDARQVSDLPALTDFLPGSLTRGHRPPVLGWALSASQRLAAHQRGRAIAQPPRFDSNFATPEAPITVSLVVEYSKLAETLGLYGSGGMEAGQLEVIRPTAMFLSQFITSLTLALPIPTLKIN